jgi:hypothetical protein
VICYLMDENVNPIYKTQLLKDFPDLTVWAVGDAGTPPKGTLDPEILVWCETNGFILVTNNRVSMPVHLNDYLIEQNHHIPGIFILNPKMTVGEIIEELAIVAFVAEDNEYQDRISYLPLLR